MAVRTIPITITDTGASPSSVKAGRVGEHNATLLVFSIPHSYTDAGYTYKVNINSGMGSNGESESLIPTLVGSGGTSYFTISYPLPRSVTLNGTANISVNVYEMDGTTVDSLVRSVSVNLLFDGEALPEELIATDYVLQDSSDVIAYANLKLALEQAEQARDTALEALDTLNGTIDTINAALDDFEQFTNTELVSDNRNLYIAGQSTANTLLAINGTTASNPAYTTSDYMLVAAGNTVIPSGVIPDTGSPKLRGAMAFYDREKTFISYLGADYDLFPVVPENAYYVRISFTEDITNVQVESAVTAMKVNTFTDYGDTQTGTVLATCDYPHGLGDAEAIVTNIRIVSEHYFKTLSVTIVDEYSFYFTDTFSEIESGYFTHYVAAVPLLLVPESSFKFIEREKTPPVDFVIVSDTNDDLPESADNGTECIAREISQTYPWLLKNIDSILGMDNPTLVSAQQKGVYIKKTPPKPDFTALGISPQVLISKWSTVFGNLKSYKLGNDNSYELYRHWHTGMHVDLYDMFFSPAGLFVPVDILGFNDLMWDWGNPDGEDGRIKYFYIWDTIPADPEDPESEAILPGWYEVTGWDEDNNISDLIAITEMPDIRMSCSVHFEDNATGLKTAEYFSTICNDRPFTYRRYLRDNGEWILLI